MKMFIIASEFQQSGKTVISSYISAILDYNNIDVQFLKLNQALSTRLGLLSPYAVGETFITHDGAQVDKDVGIIERSIKGCLSSMSCLTLGQAIDDVNATELNSKDCAYDFLSMDDQLIQHIVQHINKFNKDQIMVIELGGSIKELGTQCFIKAINELSKIDDIEIIYIGDDLQLPNSKFLNPPKLCINFKENKEFLLKKMVNSNIQQAIDKMIHSYLAIKLEPVNLEETYLHIPYEKFEKAVKIAIVGRFVPQQSAYLSIIDNLKSCCFQQHLSPIFEFIQPKFLNLSNVEQNFMDVDCIIVPGGFGQDLGAEGLIIAIHYGRTKKIPTLGIGFGLQMMVVEFARNVCNLQKANSYEIDQNTADPVVHRLEYLLQRLSIQETTLSENNTKYHIMHVGDSFMQIEEKFDNIAQMCFNSQQTERAWHSFTINHDYWEQLENKGLLPIMWDSKRQEIFAVQTLDHPFYFGTQIHPEFRSRYQSPHQVFVEFIKAAKMCQRNPRTVSVQGSNSIPSTLQPNKVIGGSPRYVSKDFFK